MSDPASASDDPSISREQARRIDQLAADELGMPGVVLMENAGINASAAVVDQLENQIGLSAPQARIVIVCGGGNNGGDGYVCARQLHNWGAAVSILAIKDPAELQGDAAVMHGICRAMGLPIEVIDKELTAGGSLPTGTPSLDWNEAHLVIDAILGTGFRGEVREHEATIIDAINKLTHPLIVSLDTPSGLDCDTGKPANSTIKADLTVSFVSRKLGFDQPRAEPYTGRVVVADIGTPPELASRV